MNESKTTWVGKNGEKAVQPLFPAFVHISLGVTAVVGILLWLWPASAIRGWSFRLPVTLAAICFLSFYVAGEMIRWRFRISLWNMFAVVTHKADGELWVTTSFFSAFRA